MKIVVLGATGNIGSRLVVRAAAAGHQVVACARNPQAVPARDGVSVVAGAAEDTAALAAAARGADVLLVSITGSMKDATFMQRTVPSIIEAAKSAQVGRLVLVSAFGAGDTAEKASGMARLVYRTVLGRFFRDKAAADEIVLASGLDCTIVYPVNLKEITGPPAAAVLPLSEVAKIPGLPTLSFDSAAQAILDVVEDPSTVGRRLVVTTPTGWERA